MKPSKKRTTPFINIDSTLQSATDTTVDSVGAEHDDHVNRMEAPPQWNSKDGRVVQDASYMEGDSYYAARSLIETSPNRYPEGTDGVLSTSYSGAEEEESFIAQKVLASLEKKDQLIKQLNYQLTLSAEEKNKLLLEKQQQAIKISELESQVKLFIRNINDLSIILDSERMAQKRKIKELLAQRERETPPGATDIPQALQEKEEEIHRLKEELGVAQLNWEKKLVEIKNLESEKNHWKMLHTKQEHSIENLLHQNEENIKNLKEHNSLLIAENKKKEELLEKKEKMYQKELKDLKVIISELESEFESECESLKIFKQQKIDIELISKEYSNFKEKSTQKMKVLVAEVKEQERMLHSLREENRRFREENDTLRKEVQSYRPSAVSPTTSQRSNERILQQDVQHLKSVLLQREREVVLLRSQLQEFTAQFAEYHLALTEEKNQAERLRAELETMTELYTNGKREREELMLRHQKEVESILEVKEVRGAGGLPLESQLSQVEENFYALEKKFLQEKTVFQKIEEENHTLKEAALQWQQERTALHAQQAKEREEQQHVMEEWTSCYKERLLAVEAQSELERQEKQRLKQELEGEKAKRKTVEKEVTQCRQAVVEWKAQCQGAEEATEKITKEFIQQKEELKKALNDTLLLLQKNEKIKLTIEKKNEKIAALESQQTKQWREWREVERVVRSIWGSIKENRRHHRTSRVGPVSHALQERSLTVSGSRNPSTSKEEASEVSLTDTTSVDTIASLEEGHQSPRDGGPSSDNDTPPAVPNDGTLTHIYRETPLRHPATSRTVEGPPLKQQSVLRVMGEVARQVAVLLRQHRQLTRETGIQQKRLLQLEEAVKKEAQKVTHLTTQQRRAQERRKEEEERAKKEEVESITHRAVSQAEAYILQETENLAALNEQRRDVVEAFLRRVLHDTLGTVVPELLRVDQTHRVSLWKAARAKWGQGLLDRLEEWWAHEAKKVGEELGKSQQREAVRDEENIRQDPLSSSVSVDAKGEEAMDRIRSVFLPEHYFYHYSPLHEGVPQSKNHPSLSSVTPYKKECDSIVQEMFGLDNYNELLLASEVEVVSNGPSSVAPTARQPIEGDRRSDPQSIITEEKEFLQRYWHSKVKELQQIIADSVVNEMKDESPKEGLLPTDGRCFITLEDGLSLEAHFLAYYQERLRRLWTSCSTSQTNSELDKSGDDSAEEIISILEEWAFHRLRKNIKVKRQNENSTHEKSPSSLLLYTLEAEK